MRPNSPDVNTAAALKDADPPHLELSAIRKTFHGVEVLQGIDITVRQGEFLAILGPSGSGKSTLLNIIGGFEQASSGTVKLENEDITGRPPYRRNVNTVFQSYALFTHMSVLDNVAYGLRRRKIPKGEAENRSRKMLELVGLPNFGGRIPSTLSGGEQQRVALARALVNEPAILLLDEPLSALDVKIRHQMQSELKRIHEETHTTFVYVTHDQEEALSLADRIAVMSKGRCEQIGSAWEVYARPATRFVADFVGDMNWFAVQPSGKRGVVRLVGNADVEIALSGPLETAPGGSVLIGVRPEHIQMSKLPDIVPAGQPIIAAKVHSIVFQGAMLVVKLKTESGLLVSIKRQIESGHHRDLWVVGQPAYLTWDVESQVAFAGGADLPRP